MLKFQKTIKGFLSLFKKKIGYCKKKGKLKNLKFIVKAFQRRFRPKTINGKIDKECLEIAKPSKMWVKLIL